MNKKYLTPEIKVEEIEKKDILLKSIEIDNGNKSILELNNFDFGINL